MNRASSATGWVRNPIMKSPELDPEQASSYELGWTWNPFTGCKNHTPEGLCLDGLFPCYAWKLAHTRLKQRYLANKHWDTRTPGIDIDHYPNLDPFYPRFWEERLYEPFFRQIPSGIFVCDMSDLFGNGIPNGWISDVVEEIIPHSPQHRFYLLTKQPQNLPQFSPFPDNCWVGVTATNESMAFKALSQFLQIEARIKYLSLEPMLGQMPHLTDYAQTNPYKPPEISWVREIVEAADKAGVKVFLKDNLYPLLHSEPNFARDKLRVGTSGKLRQEMPSIPSE